jgi:hypothetical protein
MTQNYWSTPIMIWGGGMGGKNNTGDEARVEASAWPDNRKVPPVTKRNRKNRGMPPPAAFDIDTLPASSNMTAMEVAAVIRRTPGALEVAARSEPFAEMALRRWSPALSRRCCARLSGWMRQDY